MMAVELQAQGLEKGERASVPLGDELLLRLGRNPKTGWKVGWDRQISREHADLEWKRGRLIVRCLDRATNPLVVGGSPARSAVIGVGDEFHIGATVFRLVGETLATQREVARAAAATGPAAQLELRDDAHDSSAELHSFRSEELREFEFSDPVRQMEMLARLPDLISASTTDEDLGSLLVDLLLEAIPASVATAVVRYGDDQLMSLKTPEATGFDPSRPAMMRVATRDDYEGRFRPSRRMISRGLRTRTSVMHIWQEGEEAEDTGQFTLSGGLDWAFCTPVRTKSCDGWCLYVAGENGEGALLNEDVLKGDLRFVELVARFIGSIRQVRLLEEQKTQLSSFFSPTVMDSLLGDQSRSLEPAQQEVSVLFCDVRGFSRKSELLQHNLLQLLASVKQALGVMANGILGHDGAIADFQGDAALGFWGWPMLLEDGPVSACRAALDIVRDFRDRSKHVGLLDGFSVGIGIAHGEAIAGEIGTDKQAKIGVFGPVVNQGARLEGLSKQLGATICMDDATTQFVKRFVPETEARTRHLVRVRPAGMDTALDVHQLLFADESESAVSNQLLKGYAEALDAVIDGAWSDALPLLELYRGLDGATDFLLRHMDALGNRAPDEWDGAFTLSKK